jgi:hypothetical protein
MYEDEVAHREMSKLFYLADALVSNPLDYERIIWIADRDPREETSRYKSAVRALSREFAKRFAASKQTITRGTVVDRLQEIVRALQDGDEAERLAGRALASTLAERAPSSTTQKRAG